MTESEYIQATNLAKLRVVAHSLRAVVPRTEGECKALDTMRVLCDDWIEGLEKRVRVQPDKE